MTYTYDSFKKCNPECIEKKTVRYLGWRHSSSHLSILLENTNETPISKDIDFLKKNYLEGGILHIPDLRPYLAKVAEI